MSQSVLLHCNGHILNFVVIDAAKSTTTSRNTFGIIAQLHNFIEGSSKMHAVFEAFQREGMKEFYLKKLSDTRWSCRAEALKCMFFVIMLTKKKKIYYQILRS